ncbi:hypothetical protein SORBI_3004G019550 [Sorghum bicolor]|uniref:Terpene synthase metal-binding domain-containing protein n=1 Tax=Sorghum bicolor TaxID=4558 RepID=A0A1Z5RKI1_SORBI|nr:hypothetical protein SORBI_3004G019550 [Sorghum bicolor]
MRSCFMALYTITNEITDMVEKEHELNLVNHLKKAWVVLFDGFMVEAKWLATNQVPTAEDYLRNGVITSGVPLAFVHLLVLLGMVKVLKHSLTTSLLSSFALTKIVRLWDDMGSAEDEAQEGFDGSYRDFYLMENPGCTPQRC